MFKIKFFPMHYTMYHISLYHSKHILEIIKKLKLGRRSQSLVKVMVQRSVALDLACFIYFSTTHEFSLCELCKCSKVSDNMSMIPLIFFIQNKTQSQNKPRSLDLVIHCCQNDCNYVNDAAENHKVVLIQICQNNYASRIGA